MFALLFDRKSGLLTLLAVGAIGVLLFAAGLVIGVNLSWEKLASHLPQSVPVPAAAPAPAATAPASSTPRTLLATPAQTASFSRRDLSPVSSPPPDWVPLADGAAWPGRAEDGAASAAEDLADETPAKPSDVRYFVQAGTFSDETGAEEMRTSLRPLCRGKRYQPFVESVWDRYGRRLVVVRIGPFPDEAAAQELSARLNGSLVGRSAGRRT